MIPFLGYVININQQIHSFLNEGKGAKELQNNHYLVYSGALNVDLMSQTS